MPRSLILFLIAVFLILIAATSVAAQGRGHFGGGGFRGGGGFHGGGAVFNSPPVVRPGGPVVVTRPPIAVARPPVNAFPVHRQPFAFGRPIHSGIAPVIVPPAFGYSPYIWPSPIYGGFGYSMYSSPLYPYSAPLYADQPYVPQAQVPVTSPNDTDLAYQVGKLSAQIEQLRQQQSTNTYVAPVPQPQESAQRTSPPIILVFRDGHRMEIHNYAIIGQTLWVLDENAATKIPISDLDIDATQRENPARGLRTPSTEK